MDNLWSEKLSWALGSGELTITNVAKFSDMYRQATSIEPSKLAQMDHDKFTSREIKPLEFLTVV